MGLGLAAGRSHRDAATAAWACPMHDPWRRRLDAVNEGRSPEPPTHALPASAAPCAKGGMRLLVSIGLVASIAAVVFVLIALFPLAWEGRAHPCSALESLLARQPHGAQQWTPVARGQDPALTMTPDATVPAWFRCHLAYWRALEVRPPGRGTVQWMARGIDGRHAAYLLGAGLILGLLALGVWLRRRRPAVPAAEDAFSLLGIEPAAAAPRPAAPPVDLTRPITGEGAWKAMRAHASDAAYGRAIETLRLRYQLVGNQMLLPNTLGEVMARSGCTFREAVLRVAEDDGFGRRP